MGDIFDLLIGEISATHEFAKPYIKLLEELALKMEIIYLEGNHDFNLARF
ncbi:UDP-2,3-diacylglucosamine diphosphatase, partial [Campylobacter coli]|nr:UDP-2,3-diacylglucosamine diphosphatase [Campylobacter coli]EAK7227366.1 UDP-2,3-diacylglucosamine diphosphatase [Campylobacter coli]EAL0287928.1 UDP-2,3-diacylglucosamine diphosphatase [Campylobacter coli]ECL0336258.1 UDP-2,3-diacylglucosamine diphosphatase [Campylobacter coli]EHM3090989.1 UDP-2,3-diacylglucosamine diphosphatase [Campylobacter coli]